MNYPEQSFHDENSIQQQADQNIPQQQMYDPRQPMSLPSGMNNRAMNSKQTYAQELQAQMRQKQEQKYRELEQERNVGVHALRARLDNDPFGRQGAGAPIRDIFGNIDTTKNKALKYMHQHTHQPVVQQNPNNFGMAPAFSLKARLARENIVSQSVDGLPRGFSQPMLGGGYPQNYPPQQPYNNQPQYPPQQYQPELNYPQSELNYPSLMQQQQQPYQMPQMPNYQMPDLQNAYMPSPNPVTNRKTHNASLPYPQPIGQGEDGESKQKRIAVHVELQNDLIRQMEEKKMRKAAEEARKKMEDEVEELRVRRENEEMLLRDQSEVDKKKRMYQNFQQDNQKLISGKGDIKNSGVVVLEPKQNETKVSVSIEQPSAKFALVQQLMKEQEQTPPPAQNFNPLNLDHIPMEDFPTQVGRHLQGSIVGQVEHLRRDWESQQNMLHDQLLDLKHQLHLANRERALTQDQIGELKSNLRDQQIGEEIRRTQLYNALLVGQNILQQKPTYSTITRFPEERDTDGGGFEFPKSRGRNMYKMNEEEDALDAMLAGQSKIISSPNIQFGNHGRFIEKPTSRPMSTHSALDGGTSMGLNYLNYYNSSEDHTGIRLDDKTGNFEIPDDWEKSGNSNFNFDESGARGEYADIYRKNRERLDRLEDLEKRELIGEHPYGREFAKGPTGIDDEIYQMLKSDDY